MAKLRKSLIFTAALLALLAVAVPQLQAQGRPSGLAVSQTGNTGNDVDLDVTLYTTYPFAATPTGYLGNRFVTPTFFYVGTMLNPTINAIDYGDSTGTISNTSVPLVAAGVPNTFRGSFTHTYPGPGAYPVTVGVASMLGYIDYATPYFTNPLLPVSTGNTVTTNVFSFSAYSPFAGTTVNLAFSVAYPFAVGITNTTEAVVASEPVIEVPTLSEIGLLLLVLVLGIAGVRFLRR